MDCDSATASLQPQSAATLDAVTMPADAVMHSGTLDAASPITAVPQLV